MILATGSMTVLITLILILPGLTLSFILISLYGFSVSLFFPPIAGWMSSGIEGASLSKAISRWNISWSTGTILSPYIAGFLSEKDIRYPVILSIGLFYSVLSLFYPRLCSFHRLRTTNIRTPGQISQREERITVLSFDFLHGCWFLLFMF